jgi:hypothetical protein
MKNSKLIDLLQALDSTELRQFCEFVASPYYNKNEELVHLAEHLEKLAPEFPEKKIKKEAVYRAIFPGQPFDKRKLAYLMNYLLKLGERFLAVQRYEKEELLTSCHILEQFVDRKLDKHYNYLMKRTEEALEAESGRDGMRYYHKFLASQVATQHFYSKQVRKFDPSLQQASDELDNFYFFYKLKYSCEMLNRQAIIEADYQPAFVDEVKKHLQVQPPADPLIEIYLHIYLLITCPEEEGHFEQLMRLIEQHALTIDRKLRREIYLYAINYGASRIKKGSSKYLQIVLDLYVKGIENRALFDEAYLSHWTYSNVVKLGLHLRHYDWVAGFIRENAVNLQPSLREDAEHYNLAELHYYQGDFDQVLMHLNQLQFSDLHYHLGSRVMLLKTYHELEAEESLFSMLASFSVYLRRNKKIAASVKRPYLNFCNLLHQLMRRNPKKWNALGESIRKTQLLTERGWLLQVWEKAGVGMRAL